ncbi:MAG TPA: asparagine synthase-related protein, partial [Vicinamibacterales bacterium]
RLPPAHAISADARGLTRTRYWRIDPAHRIRYARDADYEAHLREIFAEAVRCRLRGTRRVAVMLSGGLDSSCILGQVQTFAEALDSPAAEAFSLTCPGRACDESRFVDEVVGRWRPVAHVCPERPLDWVAIAQQEASRYLDVPTYPNSSAADPMRVLIRDHRCGVALSGVGGDEWFRGSASVYADLMRGGRLAALGRRVWQDSSGPDFVGWRAAARLTTWPLIPQPMQRFVKAALRRDITPASVSAGFAGETALRRRLGRLDRDWRFADVARREILCEATSGEAVRALEQIDRSAGWFGFEERHPFLDRRLAEFAFAIPPEQHWRGGWPKSLMRRAFRHLLPVSVATRRGRPDYSHWVIDAVQAHARAGLFERLITADLGWVEPRPVRRAYDEMIGSGRRGLKWLWPLWAICAVEHWARVVFDAPPLAAHATR